jgi:hypothetical protein
MRLFRYISVAVTAGGILWISGALRGNRLPIMAVPSVPGPAVEDAPEPPDAMTADPAAMAELNAAVTALAPSRVQWLETTIHQTVQITGFSYEAEGCLLADANNRFRLDLRTRLGKIDQEATAGESATACDGVLITERVRAANGPWLPSPPLRLAEIAGVERFTGVASLLQSLQRKMLWVQREERNGQVRLLGIWPPGSEIELAPANEPWPEGLPRCCRLTLDSATHWPLRVEWWGPAGGIADVMLARMELSIPVINQPPSSEKQAALFTLDVGR